MKWCALLLCAWPVLAQKTHEFCAACHTEQVTDFQSHPHFQKNLSCDICHGASVKHRTSTGAAAPDRVAAPDEVPALCGTCHEAALKEYLTSKHAALLAQRAKVKTANCGGCHGVHGFRAAAQIERQCHRCHSSLPASHPKMQNASCTSCHAKHTLAAKR